MMKTVMHLVLSIVIGLVLAEAAEAHRERCRPWRRTWISRERDTWVDVSDAIAWDLIPHGRHPMQDEGPRPRHSRRRRASRRPIAAKPDAPGGSWQVFEGDANEKGVVHEHHHDHDGHDHDGHDHDHGHAKK